MNQALATDSLPDMTGRTDDTAPSKREAIRQLVSIGHSGASAHQAYDRFRTRRDRALTWVRYIDLMTETPGGRKPRVARDHRLKVSPT